MAGEGIDPRLKEWATPAQIKYIEAIELHGGARAAAKAMGLHHSSVGKAIERLKAHAARQGYSPDHDMTRSVPDGFLLKGVSTYYDKDGNAAGQWVKSSVDRERQAELFKAAAEAMAEELPRLAPIAKPQRWPAEIVTFKAKREGAPEFNAKIDFHPKTGKPWGVFIWRTDRTTQDVDDDLDDLSRKISRVMQRRYP